MERMIAELFPCASDGDPSGGKYSSATSQGLSAARWPSLEEFLKHICRRTRTPLPCMCLALLYLTRLRANHPRSRGSPGSSYRLALSSLCVATKYLYDDAYHTCSWVQVSMGMFSQREVNQMEMEFMYFLHYQLGVTPTEWNQWIATLEAKLVSRWQESDKADIIYSFGLFLSYECCEPSAQEAVRDVAWGEGGKSLLALLNTAIHLPGGVDPAKCSPSADSAVSDATCLPTPDPNSCFRIRSPALPSSTPRVGASTSGVAGVGAPSASITPTTAHFSDVAAAGDEFGKGAQPRIPSSYTRPSSSCSVPGKPNRYASVPGTARSSQPHPPHLEASDWGHPAGDGMTPRHMSGMDSGQTMTNTSLSRSGESEYGSRGTDKARVPLGTVSSQSHSHYGTGPRTATASTLRGTISAGGYPADMSFRRSSNVSAIQLRAASMTAGIPGPPTAPAGYGASVTPSSTMSKEYGYGTADPAQCWDASRHGASAQHSATETQKLVSQHGLGPTSSRADSPSGGERRGRVRHFTGGNASVKSSSSSSLRGNSRRQSWRHSSRHSAANFAQKLRSLAAFSWSSNGSGGSDGRDGESRPRAHGSAAAAAAVAAPMSLDGGSYDDFNTYAGQSLPPGAVGFGRLMDQGHGRYAYPSQSSSTAYSSGGGGGHHHALHPDSSKQPNWPSEMHGRRTPLPDSRKGTDGLSALYPSHEIDLDVAKYVSMRS
ncbi:hypothetical protein GGF46_002904 [Coemansia sp. RSA 552]|nr:hypothetical protein GGF46_002904 [Coemansia sp. RSA 552]